MKKSSGTLVCPWPECIFFAVCCNFLLQLCWEEYLRLMHLHLHLHVRDSNKNWQARRLLKIIFILAGYYDSHGIFVISHHNDIYTYSYSGFHFSAFHYYISSAVMPSRAWLQSLPPVNEPLVPWFQKVCIFDFTKAQNGVAAKERRQPECAIFWVVGDCGSVRWRETVASEKL